MIADVSDKGVPAALFMMMSKTRINGVAMADKCLSPGEILKKTNDLLCVNNDSSMFVTVWLGILTLSTGELVTSNGGHEDPFIMSEGRFSLCKEDHYLPLGLYPGVEYKENRWTLAKNDIIFLYTDGAAEAFNKENAQFGTDGILEALNANRDKSLPEILDGVTSAVNDFTGGNGSQDDLTMLALQYYNRPFLSIQRDRLKQIFRHKFAPRRISGSGSKICGKGNCIN